METIVIPNIEQLADEPTAPGKISIEVTRRTPTTREDTITTAIKTVFTFTI